MCRNYFPLDCSLVTLCVGELAIKHVVEDIC